MGEVKDGTTAGDIAKSQPQDLKLAQKEWDAKVQAAEDSSRKSMDLYRGVFDKWLGINLGEEDIGIDPDTLLDSWGIDLDYIYDERLRFQDIANQDITNGVWAGWMPPADDPATPWSEPTVYYWLNFYPVAIVATCEDEAVPSQEVCVSEEMQDAWDAYQGSMDSLASVEVQASKVVASADATVTKAEDSLAAAQETLADLQAGPDSLEVDVKEKQLVAAQANMAEAEDDLAEMLGGIDLLDQTLLEADVAVEQLALETAIQRLDGATIEAPMSGIVSLANI